MRLFALLLAGILLGGCAKPAPTPVAADSAATAPALIKLRLQTDWYPQAEHGGFYQALAKGYYKDVGLDVEILPGGPGPLVTQKILAGIADISIGASDSIIYNVSSGLPFLIIGDYMQHDPQAILVHADSPITTFEQLDGQTIMAVPGSDWILYLKARYKMDFKLIPSNFGIAQFMADKTFIQQCFITNEPYFTAQNGVKSRALLIADSGFEPYRILFTTQRFAREHPEALKKFVAASVRGWADFMTGDPTPGKKLILEKNDKMTAAFMDYSIAAMKASYLVTGRPGSGEQTGLMTAKRLGEQSQLLADLKIISAPVPLDKFVSFDFLPPELQALAK